MADFRVPKCGEEDQIVRHVPCREGFFGGYLLRWFALRIGFQQGFQQRGFCNIYVLGNINRGIYGRRHFACSPELVSDKQKANWGVPMHRHKTPLRFLDGI